MVLRKGRYRILIRRFNLPDLDDICAQLLHIYREVLGTQEVSLEDNLFDLGGSSMTAMRVIKRTAERLGVRIGAHAVFTAGTIRDVALQVELARRAETEREPVPRTSAGGIRASMAQEWAVLASVHEPDAPALQFHAVYRVRGPFDVAALNGALQAVVDQHPALRTVLRVDGPVVRPHLVGAAIVPFCDDLTWLPEQDRFKEAMRLLDSEVRRPNPACGI
jgi:acyl carrier protein